MTILLIMYNIDHLQKLTTQVWLKAKMILTLKNNRNKSEFMNFSVKCVTL